MCIRDRGIKCSRKKRRKRRIEFLRKLGRQEGSNQSKEKETCLCDKLRASNCIHMLAHVKETKRKRQWMRWKREREWVSMRERGCERERIRKEREGSTETVYNNNHFHAAMHVHTSFVYRRDSAVRFISIRPYVYVRTQTEKCFLWFYVKWRMKLKCIIIYQK